MNAVDLEKKAGANLFFKTEVELLDHRAAQAIVDDIDAGGACTGKEESAERAGKDLWCSGSKCSIGIEVDGNTVWSGDDVAGGDVKRESTAVEAFLERHDFESDAVVVDTVAAVNAEVGIEGVVEADARSPVVVFAVAGALIERLNDGVALRVPAQVVEIGIHLPAKAEIESEVAEDLPVVLSKEGQVEVVIVWQVEGTGGIGAAETDGEEKIVVVDFAVLVAVEVRKVFDGLDVSLLEDSEVEVRVDGLDLSAEGKGVFAYGPCDCVVTLEPKLQSLLWTR